VNWQPDQLQFPKLLALLDARGTPLTAQARLNSHAQKA
jgi:hypothetical protein